MNIIYIYHYSRLLQNSVVVKTVLFDLAVSQLLNQLIQVGLVAVIASYAGITAKSKITDFSDQTRFSIASLKLRILRPTCVDRLINEDSYQFEFACLLTTCVVLSQTFSFSTFKIAALHFFE